LDRWGGLRTRGAQTRKHVSFSKPKRPESLFGEPDPSLSFEHCINLYLERRFLPWRRDGGRILVAIAGDASRDLAWLRAYFGRVVAVPIGQAALDEALARRFRKCLSRDSVYALASKRPMFSARIRMTRLQKAVTVAGGAVCAAAVCVAPLTILHGFVAVAAAGFGLSSAARLALAFCGMRSNCVEPIGAPRLRHGKDLPVYTILVPLYREAAVLPRLTKALLALDYPKDRLDIKLIVEEDDLETRTVADSFADFGAFEIVVVPLSRPRTKPKACNFALNFARGEYLVIYDAEDRPEPDQLQKAVAAFRNAPPEVVCLQARLAIDNAADSWISAIFSIDYDVWFSALLPGLDRLRLPMPLGGTSNHFRIRSLREANGWDPFNVTEDADLGIRLTQLGHRVAMLDSTTYEEAPNQLGVWIRQRTRWLKGYMQTLLVHTRNPAGFLHRVGFRGALALQLFLGGVVLSALANALLWLVFLVSVISPHWVGEAVSQNWLVSISGGGLLASNTLLAGFALTSRHRSMHSRLFFYGAGFVLYWMLISVAAWRALWQLAFSPFLWEKTPHGCRLR
jgi:glycosyltransferase XagB